MGSALELLRFIDPNHAGHVTLSDDQWRRLYVWLDGNAPFYGTYGPQEQRAQRNAEAVAPPRVQ